MNKTTIKRDGASVSVYLDGPRWENRPCATLGAFSCKVAEAGRAVLADALKHVKEAGIDRVIGPMNGDTWHSYRFVTETDGSPPFLLEPTNKPQDAELFREAGFAPISQYFSARVPLIEAARNTPAPAETFEIETWNGDDPEGLFAQVFDVSVRAFAGNAFYKPISRQDFLAMYMPVVPMIRKDLIFFARGADGSLAGFLFGIPNYAEGPQTKTVILKTYASLVKGAGQHLAYCFHKAADQAGFDTAIHALIHADNLSALRSAAEGADVFRRYTLFGLRLDG